MTALLPQLCHLPRNWVMPPLMPNIASTAVAPVRMITFWSTAAI